MRVTELAEKLRARGLTVVEVAGWQTRGNEFPSRPDGAIRHWTAGPATGDTPTLNICTNGRTGLPGPLCNTFQSRRVDANGFDVVYLVAAGKANHAGEGGWNGMSGNYSVLGLEIEWSGPNESFANVRRRKLTSELIMRAMMDCTAGTNDNDCCEHREWAPTRKIDTNLSGDELRRRMTELRTGASPTPGEEDMPMPIICRGDNDPTGKWWITDAVRKDHIETVEIGAATVYLGFAKWDNGGPFVVNQAWIDSIPTGLLTPTPAPPTVADIAKAVVAALPAAATGGLTSAQVQAAAEAAIKKVFAPIYDAIT